MNYFLLTFFCHCFLIFNSSNAQFDGDDCTFSHNQKTGICKDFKKCSEVIALHRQGVRYTTCSYSSGVHYVCCPSRPPPSNPAPNSRGRVSVTKCEEYKSKVKKVVQVGGLTTIPKLHEISADTCEVSTGLIVGGMKTSNGEFPHSAAIGKRDADIQFFCGGSLISEKFVLTAAHCKNGQNLFARLGDQNIRSLKDGLKEIDIPIIAFIVHEEYNRQSKQNDIALAKLRNDVVFTKNIRPACLWQSFSIDSPTVIATGWGNSEFAGTPSDELLKVQLNVLNNNECINTFDDGYVIVNDNQICAGVLTGGKDTCQGDSGGPIQIVLPNDRCVYQIVGVTSFGGFCGGRNSPSLYTRVSAYIDWIEQKVWEI